jgi:hypothetical protein
LYRRTHTITPESQPRCRTTLGGAVAPPHTAPPRHNLDSPPPTDPASHKLEASVCQTASWHAVPSPSAQHDDNAYRLLCHYGTFTHCCSAAPDADCLPRTQSSRCSHVVSATSRLLDIYCTTARAFRSTELFECKVPAKSAQHAHSRAPYLLLMQCTTTQL